MSETCPAELPNWCARRHWSIFWILILCSTAVVAGRVLTLGDYLPASAKPFFSANDRSRWTTVRALGDQGTFQMDGVIGQANGKQWNSIDKVQHVGPDGLLHYYSSKPPLLPVLVTGAYKSLKLITGYDIETDSFVVVRILLTLINVVPWAIFLWFAARMLNSVPVRDWTRYYILACAGFGTYLATFAVTLNNHLPAAVSVMIALYCASEILRRDSVAWYYYAAAGLMSAFAVSNEMPALAFLACIGLVCMTQSIAKSLFAFVPAALLVAAAFFGTNYWAHGQWKPAYAQRSDGKVLATVSGDFAAGLNDGKLPENLLRQFPVEFKFKRPTVEIGAWPNTSLDVSRWVVRDEITSAQLAIVTTDQKNFDIRAWENWYDYPGSYWLSTNDAKKSTVDLGQESQSLYTFHILFGHHGIFSLTPIWLLSLAGMVALLFGATPGKRNSIRLVRSGSGERTNNDRTDDNVRTEKYSLQKGQGYSLRWLGALGLAVSIAVLAFYVTRPAIDRNYGGYCCSLRWLLWLAPIWLMSMLPVVDWLGGWRWGKLLCFGLLFYSAVSAFYPANNPWVLPWLYEVWDWTGLPK